VDTISNVQHGTLNDEGGKNMRKLEKKVYIIKKINTKYLHDELTPMLYRNFEKATKKNAQ